MTYSLEGIANGSSSSLALAGHYDLLRIIKDFAAGGLLEKSNTIASSVNKIKRLAVMANDAPAETWTVSYEGTPASMTVSNGDAETGDMTGWSNVTGWTAVTTSNSIGSPYAGTYFFSPGTTGIATAEQTIDISSVSSVILDSGEANFIMEWRQAGRADDDSLYWTYEFLTSGDVLISSTTGSFYTENDGVWKYFKEVVDIPATCRKVKITMHGDQILASANNVEVDAITATVSKHRFTVTGSTSGAQADAFPGQFYNNFLVQFFIMDEDETTQYSNGETFTLSSYNGVRTLYTDSYTGTGNGEIIFKKLLASTSETWTLTCTAAATNGGTFSVTGSSSGLQVATATVGTPYESDSGEIQFLINDGTTDFAVNDEFVLTAVAQQLPEVDRWVVDRWDDTTDDYELIMTGVGRINVGPVTAGFRSNQDVAGDYYNLDVATMEGYTSSNSFDVQNKLEGGAEPLWQDDIPYKLRISPRVINCVVNVESLYSVFFTGQYKCNYDPTQYPYPTIVGSSLDTIGATTRYDNTARNWALLGNDARLQVHWLDGTYKTPKTLPYNSDYWSYAVSSVLQNVVEPTDTVEQSSYTGTGNGVIEFIARSDDTSPFETWTVKALNATTFSVTGSISLGQANATVGTPYDNGICRFLITAGGTAFVLDDEFEFTLGKSYALERIVLVDADQIYGELEGLSSITGFANSVENTTTDENSDVHFVFRNINRTGFLDYAALIMD